MNKNPTFNKKSDELNIDKSQPVFSKEVFDAIGMPIFITDANMENFAGVNKKAVNFFGKLTTVEALAKKLEAVGKLQFGQALQKSFDTGKEQSIPVIFRKKSWAATFFPFSTGVTIILQQQEADAALEMAELGQSILNATGDYFILTDADLNILNVNPKYIDALGMSIDEIRKHNATDFSEEMTIAQMKEYQKQAEKGSILFDTRKKAKNGSVYDFEVNYMMVEVRGKKYYASFARNVTEFKNTQRELEKSNHRFELIAEATQEALWELNNVTGERWANNVHQRLYGLTKNDPVPGSLQWQNSIDATVRNKIVKSLDTAISRKETKWNAEYWFRTHTGKDVYIYDRTLMYYAKNGTLEKMMGSMVDITALKNAQEQLNNQMSLSEGIINSLPGVFYLLDKNGGFIRWNKNFETLTGYNAKEIKAMKAHDFFYHKESDALSAKISEVFQKGWAEMEGNLMDKNGVGRPFYLSGWRTVIGNEECLIGTGIDMSEIKKAQESLKRMELKITEQKIQEQKTISRAIINAQEKERNYIGRELHDNVNQLLAGARLYLTMGAKKEKSFGEMIKYPLELLDNGIQEIRHLTHRNITPSKDVELKQLLEGIKDLLKAGSIECSFRYDVERTLNESLLINVYRILQEQANNIIKHSRASIVTIKVEDKGPYLYIETIDDGVGFDVHKLREGIGLYNIYSRVEAYNGEVEIESAPGKGCIIEIKFPIFNNEIRGDDAVHADNAISTSQEH